MKNMKIVVAVDSFKGSATSKEVSEYIEKVIKHICKDAFVKKIGRAHV